MYKFIFPRLLGLVPQPALCQTDRPPLFKLMESAKVKTVIQADTVAGKTNVLLASIDEQSEVRICLCAWW